MVFAFITRCVAICLFYFVVGVEGHGAVIRPIPRFATTAKYCPWCVGEHHPIANSPGESNRSAVPSSPCLATTRLGPRYDKDRFGKYRDIADLDPSGVVAGTSLEAAIAIDADHNGVAYWAYCPHSETETEACFRQRPLTKWTDVHAYWGSPPDCGDHCKSGKTFTQTVFFPGDMKPGLVTLRWLWVCKNTDEIFLSCIDVQVAEGTGSGSTSLPPLPEVGVVPEPTPNSSSQSPTSGSSSDPDKNQGDCADSWMQCGGKHWTGPVCCSAGWTCTFSSIFHSQCEPEDVPGQAALSQRSLTVDAGVRLRRQRGSRGHRFLGLAPALIQVEANLEVSTSGGLSGVQDTDGTFYVDEL